MTIAANIAALQTRHAALSPTVKSAPATYPTSLNSGMLPLVLTDASKGKNEWDTYGGDLVLETRTYRVRCFCLPTGLGEGIDQGKQQAIAVLDAILASYRTTPGLTSTAAIRVEAGIEDTGIVGTMQYTDPDTRYWGFELQVSVEERWE